MKFSKQINTYFSAHLPGDGDLIIIFKSQWTMFLVRIIKCDRHSCLIHSSLPIFIN